MVYLNERWFSVNDTWPEASGYSLGDGIRERHGGAAAIANGGIQTPVRTPFPVGTNLVRFDGSSRPAVARNGKWWMLFSEYKLVQAFADAQGMSVAAAVAELCYVPEEWNNMHVVIQAKLKSPLLAYTGVGRAAQGRTRAYPVRGDGSGRQIEQAFIPGLHDTNVHDALMITGVGFIGGR